MVFIPRDPSLIGLDLTQNSLKKAVLRPHRAGWIIESLNELSLNSANFSSAIGKNATTVSSLETRDVLVRSLEVPLTKEEDIRAALPFQAEPLLPYSLDSALLQSTSLETVSNKTSLTLFSVKKDHLKSHLDSFNALSINPEIVSCTPVALASLFAVIHPVDEPLLVVYMGDLQTTVVLLQKGKVLASRGIDFGNTALAHSFSLSASPDCFKAVNISHLTEKNSLLNVFRKELFKAVLALMQKVNTNTLYLIGGASENDCWKNYLQSHLKKEIHSAKANAFLPVTQENLHRFGLCIGLALSAKNTVGSKLPINFRKEEFVYTQPLKNYKTPLLVFFCLSLILTCSFAILNNGYQKLRLTELKQDYLSLLATDGKTFDEAEELFKKDNVARSTLTDLTPSELLKRVELLENKTKNHPELYPLFPQIPRVSDFLAWLSTLPQIATDSLDNHHSSAIIFDEIHYSLVKHPDLVKKKEHYLLKVELEFSAENPSRARAFHDTLLEPNPFINSKHEVQWSSYKNKYKTSFYLKDLTRYY